MHGVSHVCGEEEGAGQGLLVGGAHVDVVGGSWENRQATNYGREHVGVSALSGTASNFLVIEQCNETDGSFLIQSGTVGHGVDQTSSSTVRTVKVVQARGENELPEQTTQTGLLRVEEDHFKIKHISRLHASLCGNELHKVRMMTLSNSLERGEFTTLRLRACGGAGSTVKLSLNKTSNREELRLFVEREISLAVKMDS